MKGNVSKRKNYKGVGSTSHIDFEMSDSSTSAVQNKVIKAYVDKITGNKDNLKTSNKETLVGAINEVVDTKADQSLENVDDEVFKQKAEQAGVGGSDVTIDTEMSDTSENPVQNKVVKEYIDTAIQKAILDSWEVAV